MAASAMVNRHMQAPLGVRLAGPSRLQAHLYTGDEVARLMRGAGRRTRRAVSAVTRLLQLLSRELRRRLPGLAARITGHG
jgi:hypothetical protein